MLVVTVSTSGRGNCAQVGGADYVYVDAPMGSFVLPATCPHRGGPLHLAQVEPGRARLVCPWHGRATSVTAAARRGIPAVRRRDEVTIVFPDDKGSEYSLRHLPLSADLSSGRTACEEAI